MTSGLRDTPRRVGTVYRSNSLTRETDKDLDPDSTQSQPCRRCPGSEQLRSVPCHPPPAAAGDECLNIEGQVQMRKHTSTQRPGHRDRQSLSETRGTEVLPVADKSAGHNVGPQPAAWLTPGVWECPPAGADKAPGRVISVAIAQRPAHVPARVSPRQTGREPRNHLLEVVSVGK